MSKLELRIGLCDHDSKDGMNWGGTGIILGFLIVAIIMVLVIAGVQNNKEN